jgi:hypothetical protein
MAQRRANIPDEAMTKEQVEVLHRVKAVLLRVIWKYAAFE